MRVRNSCEGWEVGLKNYRLLNNKNQCKIPIPTYCELGIRNNWFDFNYFATKCNKKPQAFDTSILAPPLQNKKGIKRLGYPRAENLDPAIATNQTLYRPWVQSNIIDMDDPNIPQTTKDNVEYIVDMSDPNDNKLNIEIKPDLLRAKEQQLLRDQIIKQEKADGIYADRLDKNVLILYIDNLSRSHLF